MDQLQLEIKGSRQAIEGIGASISTYTQGRVLIRLQSINEEFELAFEGEVIPSITSDLPSISLGRRTWPHLQGIHLADPQFGTPRPIDVLVGADIWGQLLLNGRRVGSRNEPCAIKTHFGWVVFGPVGPDRVDGIGVQALSAQFRRDHFQLEELLQRFWSLEEPEGATEEQVNECEAIFRKTVNRDDQGRYVVQIPFRGNAPALGDSRQNALRQFYQLERRLTNSPELREKYVRFMREYLALNHMEVVTDKQEEGRYQCYYIPHHAVTTKFRVVFNASAKTSTGVSLNETQLVGPRTQDPLTSIIHRFRRFRVAITADVEKMFRQITVDTRHRRWQRIFWRESPIDPLKTYELKTVTFGMASGPFNAIRTLQQCAMDNYQVISDDSRAIMARQMILSNFYVDDFLASVDSPELAVNVSMDIRKILECGHFQLRKWNSNCWETLTAIAGSPTSEETIKLSDVETTVLGLHWNPIEDELLYKVELHQGAEWPTKRSVLSDVGKLYDPTGMLAPVIVVAKIFIQTLWRAGLEWDAPLTAELRDSWILFREALPQLSQLRIPRWLGMRDASKPTLLGFCDASTKAYAAVIYIHVNPEGSPSQMAIVASKTRVAPVKEISIPRLELAAAQLLAKLLKSVQQSLDLRDIGYHLWTDSSVVLSWLRKPPSSLKQYASNRVAYIQENTDIHQWHHIRSESNPADCASRGLSPAELRRHPLWWNGPTDILEKEPKKSFLPAISDGEWEDFAAEIRPVMALTTRVEIRGLTMTTSQGEEIPLLARFSSLQKLLRVTAYVLRFRPHRMTAQYKTFVTSEEIGQAMRLHVTEEQRRHFGSEISSLSAGHIISSSSKIACLKPFLDKEGIIRVGGRLPNADLAYEQRHPIILPKTSLLSKLLVSNAHHITLHGGIGVMLQLVRRKFWIIHLRGLVKSHIYQCVACKLQQQVLQRQQMADLPRSRVTVAPPFSQSGVDYAGPLLIKQGNRRTASLCKTYAVIFVCMVTKAVHIELAEDLSARGFIDVFDRFVSRRGYCQRLYSDNGTQFVGAKRLLGKDLEEWRTTQVTQHIADAGVEWRFITPSAAHHGGLWEAAVKSAKRHLLRVVGKQVLRFNSLSTLLVRIEACLNSRPIVALHDDLDTGTALTPGDFLIGRPIVARPETCDEGVPVNRLKYHQQLQRMLQQFWKRWSEEYLRTLQMRGKWTRPVPNVRIGDVVAIQQENLPPTRWRIGRVIAVHPGKDGLIRTVTIEHCTEHQAPGRTLRKTQCQRPVQKLCRLMEAEDDDQERNTPGQGARDEDDNIQNGGSAGQDVEDRRI